MKKSIKQLTALCLAFLVMISIFTPPTSANEVSLGKTFQTLYAEMDTKSLTLKEINDLAEIGWNVEEGKIIQTRKVTDGNIVVNGQSIAINDGVFEIENAKNVIEVETSDGIQTISRNGDGEFIVVQEIDWVALMDHMDKSDEISIMSTAIITPKPYGSKYAVGDQVHCNRFNGTFSNDVHYSKSGLDLVLALKNFANSDCDIALLNWRNCDNSNWCNVAGNGDWADCSVKIGHKKTYHRH